jgi:hypothetical protein
MKRWFGRTCTILAVVVSIAALTAPAYAGILEGPYWSAGDEVGSCGDTHNGYVIAVQEFLQVSGAYSGDVDDDFGSATKAAVEQYQSNHSLTVDGCVGPNTWTSLQTYPVYQATMTICSFGGGPEVDYWRYRRHSTDANYYRRTDNGVWFAGVEDTLDSSPVYNDAYRFSNDLTDFYMLYC